jgi:hypothetical protein
MAHAAAAAAAVVVSVILALAAKSTGEMQPCENIRFDFCHIFQVVFCITSVVSGSGFYWKTLAATQRLADIPFATFRSHLKI